MLQSLSTLFYYQIISYIHFMDFKISKFQRTENAENNMKKKENT